MADIVARRAEQHRGFGFMVAQQVDHRIFDIRRRNRHRLIDDIDMALLVIDGRNAQRFVLITLGQRDNRLGHGRRKQQRPAGSGGGVEDFLEIVAKAHVEHFVGLVEHGELQRRQVEHAAFEMIAQAARGADDDMRAGIERAAFARRVHAADASGDAQIHPRNQPGQLQADLQGQLAGRRDHQRQRRARRRQRGIVGQQLHPDGKAESHGLARAGARGNHQVAAQRFGLNDRRLDGGRLAIAPGGEGVGERGGQFGKQHGPRWDGTRSAAEWMCRQRRSEVRPAMPKIVGDLCR